MNKIQVGKSIRIKLEITEIDFERNINNIVYGFEDIISPNLCFDSEGRETNYYKMGSGDYIIEIVKDLSREEVIETYILNRINVDSDVIKRNN